MPSGEFRLTGLTLTQASWENGNVPCVRVTTPRACVCGDMGVRAHKRRVRVTR